MNDTIDTIYRSRLSRRSYFPDWQPVSWLTGLLNRLLVWQDRASARAHLAAMSDAELKDVGLSRADVTPELAKPFWQV